MTALGLCFSPRTPASSLQANSLQQTLLEQFRLPSIIPSCDGRRSASATVHCDAKRRLSCAEEDRRLVEGVVDLAFREKTAEFTGWTVVDFKTDREVEKSRDRYAAQVAT